MTPEIFPPAIEQCFLIAGYMQQGESNVIRSGVEVGPAKLRRRYTMPIRNVKASMKLTTDELRIFDTFFHSVLMSGVKRFLFADPVSGTQKEYRFIDPPVYSPISEEFWSIEMSLEMVP